MNLVPKMGEYIYPYPLNPPRISNTMPKGGILIELEGLDGAGKSSQLKYIYEKLSKRYPKVYVGNFINYEYIRDILLKTKYENSDEYTFTLMYTMGLANYFNTEVSKRLEEGYIVVLDRYIDTIISKALVRNVDRDWVESLLSIFRKPDINIFIDTRPEICLERKKNNTEILSYWECGCAVINDEENRFHYDCEKYEKCFLIHQSKIRNIFLNEILNERFIVNGEEDINVVNSEIMAHIERRIGNINE